MNRTLARSLAKAALLIAAMSFSFIAWGAEDPLSGCKNAIELYAEDPDAALDEARWCVDMLEQVKQDAVASSFKDQVGDYVGGAVEQQNALGMSMVSREYSHNGKTITVQQMAAAGQGNPLGALGALAQYGQGRKVRIAGNTGTLMADGGNVTLMLSMRDGGNRSFESYDASGDEVLAFAREFMK